MLDRTAGHGWTIERAKVDDIDIGLHVAQAACDHGVAVQVTARDADVTSFRPLV